MKSNKKKTISRVNFFGYFGWELGVKSCDDGWVRISAELKNEGIGWD